MHCSFDATSCQHITRFNSLDVFKQIVFSDIEVSDIRAINLTIRFQPMHCFHEVKNMYSDKRSSETYNYIRSHLFIITSFIPIISTIISLSNRLLCILIIQSYPLSNQSYYPTVSISLIDFIRIFFIVNLDNIVTLQ